MSDIRELVREAIREYVHIGRGEIEAALENLDLGGLVADAVAEQLPGLVENLVADELEDAVADALSDALS